ncbi:unnamed protein product, partial [Adineta steineri]
IVQPTKKCTRSSTGFDVRVKRRSAGKENCDMVHINHRKMSNPVYEETMVVSAVKRVLRSAKVKILFLEMSKAKRCQYLSEAVLKLVYLCLKEHCSLYAEAQITGDEDIRRAYDYVRKHRKDLSIKVHTDDPMFINEKRVALNDLILLTEEEVDKVIMMHYGKRFGCGTRALHDHLNQIYCKVSEAQIVKVTKASDIRGQMHPVFSNKGPKKIIEAKQVFERLQVDLVDLSRRTAFENGVEYRYVLVVVDIFSRFMFLRPLTHKSSVEVCHHLEQIFREHGTPNIIQTDRGTEFHGFFDELCNKRNIKHIRSRAYHPQSQGKVERLNRSWKNKMVYDNLINGNPNWVGNLSLYSEAYNHSKHRGLGNLTPFFVYFGREAVVGTSSNKTMSGEDIEDSYVELNDEEPVSNNILNNSIQAKQDAREKGNEKMQQYYEKQNYYLIYESAKKYTFNNICRSDKVIVKLTGKKYALSKRKNVTRAGTIVQAKHKEALYLIKYEYNNSIQQEWFSVDNITCRTVQEQEERLLIASSKCTNNKTQTEHRAKKMKIAHSENAAIQNKISMVDQPSDNTSSQKKTCLNYSHQNISNYSDNKKISSSISTNNKVSWQSDDEAIVSEQFKDNCLNESEHTELEKSNNGKHVSNKINDTSSNLRFEITHFYPDTLDELQDRKYTENCKECVSCDPAIPYNGGAITEGNLTFVFVATCTLDYFLQFIRLAFLYNDCFRYFLIPEAEQHNIVAQTLLEMQDSLYSLDWNMARFIWVKMIGIVDKELQTQHRFEKTLNSLKVFQNSFNSLSTYDYDMHLFYQYNVHIDIAINLPVRASSRDDDCSHNNNQQITVINAELHQPVIGQYDTRSTENCGAQIIKWSSNIPLSANVELKYLKKTKINDEECTDDESGIYLVCAGQRSRTAPTFINATHPPFLIITNLEEIITTANIPRDIVIDGQKYLLFGTTSYKPGHFIGMILCLDHQQETIVDNLFRTTEGVHVVSRAFYIKSE